jgi:hypothetical protein
VGTVRELVTASRARQGLPAVVADPAVLRRLAALFSGPARTSKVDAASGAGRDVSPASPGSSSAAPPAGGSGRHGPKAAA